MERGGGGAKDAAKTKAGSIPGNWFTGGAKAKLSAAAAAPKQRKIT